MFQPRTTWRLLPDIFGIITGTDGKDYSIGLGKAATYIATRSESGLIEREFLDAGEAAPPGAIIYYYLSESLPADSDACLSITDDAGNPVRRVRLKPADYNEWDDADKAVEPGPWMPSKAGVNRFIWDARHPAAERLRTNKTAFEAERGPLALPGGYQVELTLNGETLSERFELVNDPRSPASQDDLSAQLELLLEIHAKLTEVYRGLAQLRDVREQVCAWRERLLAEEGFQSVHDSAASLLKQLDDVESALILPGEQKDLFGLHDRVRLNAALASVISVIESADNKPTTQSRELAEDYMKQIVRELDVLYQLLDTGVAAFNQSIADAGLPAVVIQAR